MKKTLLLLVTIMLASYACAQSKAGLIFGYTYQGNEMFYEIKKNGKVQVTSKVKPANTTERIVIPARVQDKNKKWYDVEGIGNNGIDGFKNVVSIEIEGRGFQIYSSAFCNCPKLESVKVGLDCFFSGTAFANCPKMKTVYVPAAKLVRQYRFDDSYNTKKSLDIKTVGY